MEQEERIWNPTTECRVEKLFYGSAALSTLAAFRCSWALER